MDEQFNSLRNIGYPVILGVFVVISAVLYTDIDTVINTLSFVEPLIIIIVALIVFSAYLLRFVKWHYFLKVCDEDISIKISAYVFFSGLIMVITPAKGGEIWKSWLLESRTGTSKSKTVVIVFAERLTDIVALLFLSISIIYTVIDIWFIITVITIGVFLLYARNILINYVSGLISDRASKNIQGSKQDVLDTTDELISPKVLSISMFLSILAWFLEGIGLWIILTTAGGDIGVLNSVSIFSTSSIVGALSFLPGGLGITEGSMVSLLNIHMIPKDMATQSTILIRVLTLWFASIIGFFVYSIGKIKEV
jgi:uncharacterized protein (TIRG00374 family)